MFKIGDKIICIEPTEELKKGKVYTVKKFRESGGSQLAEIYLEEVEYSYRMKRFVPNGPVQPAQDAQIFMQLFQEALGGKEKV